MVLKMRNLFALTWLLALAACSSVVPTPVLSGQPKFPTVTGENLDKKTVVIPDDFNGKPALLLIGYIQRAQFDIDRWILGILQAEIPVSIVEVPTIAGMFPEILQNTINNGMRSGIPNEDWGSVVTVYNDADKIIAAIGNERPQSAAVVLLDRDGKIIWFYNQGYSAKRLLDLKNMVSGAGAAEHQ